jgi:hypothetical protein
VPISNDSAWRTDPGGGQRLRVKKIVDPWDGNEIVNEVVAFGVVPRGRIKIGATESVADRVYPYVGATNMFAASASSGATVVRLANGAFDSGAGSGANALDPTGAALVIMSGNAVGDFRIITGWNAGAPTGSDKSVTLHRGVSGSLTTSDAYRLGLYCAFDTVLKVKAEFSSADPTISCEIVVYLFDIGLTYANAPRAPIPDAQGPFVLSNLGKAFESGARYHGNLLKVGCEGGTLACVQLLTPPASGTVDLWLASS